MTQNSKRVVFALLAVSTIGLLAAPAKADNALIQESVQESVVTFQYKIPIKETSKLLNIATAATVVMVTVITKTIAVRASYSVAINIATS